MLTPADHIEIREVLADYGHVVDDHDWDRAEDVFMPDVVFESHNGEMVLNGISDIVATFKGRNMYAHVTTNTTLRENNDGTVSDQLVRTPAGWRLAHRRAEIRQRKFFD